jgi:formylglycine-generating enzyme required for sulfatase activity
MKIEYCHQCNVRIEESDFTEGAVHVGDKPYCAACAPVFGATSSILMTLPASEEDPGLLPKPDGSKFWFCESCNKRLTEVDLAEGKGFDKQLRGKYCVKCAPGVSTHEFTPLRDPAPQTAPPKKHLAPHPKPAPVREKREPERIKEGPQRVTATYAAYAGLVAIVAIAAWLVLSREKTEPAKALAAAQPVAKSTNSPPPDPISAPVEPSTVFKTRGDSRIKVPRTKEFRIELADGIFMDFVLIPSGKFTMGYAPDEPARNIEAPREITLTRSFYIAKLETQQAQYRSLMGDSEKCFRRTLDLPSPAVASFENAQRFCQELSLRLDLPAGIPTEAEWEYACRAGTTGSYNTPGKLDDIGWYRANADGRPHRCGEKQPNAWGLFDMHGNEREWVMDGYGPYPGGPQIDPLAAHATTSRVLRGGNYSDDAGDCRSAYRRSSLVQYPNGFRAIIRLP